jgi:hypothetical protein
MSWSCGFGSRGCFRSGGRGTFIFLTPGKTGEGEQKQNNKQFSRKYPTGLVQFHLAFSL